MRLRFALGHFPFMGKFAKDQAQTRYSVQERTSYKAAFVRLRSLKSEIEHLQLLVEHATAAMKRGSDAWRGSAFWQSLPDAALCATDGCAHAGQGRRRLRTALPRMPGQRWPSWRATRSLRLHRQRRLG